MKSCTYCGAQYPDVTLALVCPIDGQSLQTEPQVVGSPRLGTFLCPACGSDDYRSIVQLNGSFSWVAFLAGGLLAVVFRNTARPKRVCCNKCETVFDIRSP